MCDLGLVYSRVCRNQAKYACRAVVSFGAATAAACQRVMKDTTSAGSLSTTNDSLPAVLSSLAAIALGNARLFSDCKGSAAVAFVTSEVLEPGFLAPATADAPKQGKAAPRRSEVARRVEVAGHGLQVCRWKVALAPTHTLALTHMGTT